MMAESTLRRHLSTLIQAGFISRKDSPNCKRYAYKNRAVEVELAYGFGLSPFFARASEIIEAAERVLEKQRALKRMRDELSVIRRDLAGVFERLTNKTATELFFQFRVAPLKAELAAIRSALETIQLDLAGLLAQIFRPAAVFRITSIS